MQKPPLILVIIARNTWRRHVSRFSSCLLAVMLCTAQSGAACPIILLGNDLMHIRGMAPRTDWRAYRLSKERSQRVWRRIAMDVDPLDKDGRLEFFPDDVAWWTEPLAETDRIVIDKQAYGERWTAKDVRPCAAKQMLEVKDPQAEDRYFYLLACSSQEPEVDTIAKAKPVREVVSHDLEKNILSSKRFAYHYQPTNQLMFDKITIQASDGTPHVVSSKSEQRIRIDVKKFFNLDLDSRDVRSTLEATRTTSLALLGQLMFYLKILFFKIDLKLSTGVSFFEDGVHVPMVLNMPVNAPDYVHPKSGLIFSWDSDLEKVTWDMQSHLPQLDTSLLTADPAKLVEHGTKYCHQERCRYRMTGKVADQQFAQDLVIPRPLVELGFFPMAALSVNQAQIDLGWESKPKVEDSRMGLYFETSRLPKGDHGWEMWIHISPQSPTSLLQCPTPAQVVGLLQTP